jgi:hypothetical protein
MSEPALTHYCAVCKRVLPMAPGVIRRAFVTVGVAHVCQGGTTRFHKWYEPSEQEDNLSDALIVHPETGVVIESADSDRIHAYRLQMEDRFKSTSVTPECHFNRPWPPRPADEITLE